MKRCPVCCRAAMLPVRHLHGQRSGKEIRLFICLWCHSLLNPSDYVENEEHLQADLQWHIRNQALNSKRAPKLLEKLQLIHPRAGSFLDIGCGLGTMVHAAQFMGMEAWGVEPNPRAVAQGGKQCGANLICDFFPTNRLQQRFDIITILHVLEHLKTPRELLEQAVKTLDPGGLLFISVPFRRPLLKQLFFILFPMHRKSNFMDNDVHVIHYSHRSMALLAREFSVKRIAFITCEGWDGYAWSF